MHDILLKFPCHRCQHVALRGQRHSTAQQDFSGLALEFLPQLFLLCKSLLVSFFGAQFITKFFPFLLFLHGVLLENCNSSLEHSLAAKFTQISF